MAADPPCVVQLAVDACETSHRYAAPASRQRRTRQRGCDCGRRFVEPLDGRPKKSPLHESVAAAASALLPTLLALSQR